MVSGASGGPAVRYLVGAVLAAVLIGDGLMIVGYTTQVHGRALPALEAGAPGSAAGVDAPVPLSPPLLPEGPSAAQPPGPPVAQPPSGPPVAQPPSGPPVARTPGGSAPSAPAAQQPEHTVPAAPVDPPDVAAKPGPPRPPSSGARHRPDSRWPDSLPDPETVARGEQGNSPFTRRCASGDIATRWCSGFPEERK